jgi:hypothetical protein
MAAQQEWIWTCLAEQCVDVTGAVPNNLGEADGPSMLCNNHGINLFATEDRVACE